MNTKLTSKEIFPYIVSIIFHPILMPTIGIFFILNSGGYFSLFPFEVKRNIILLILGITVAIPMAIIPLLLLTKHVKSFRMFSTKERKIPMLLVSAAYYLAYVIFKDFEGVYVLKIFLLSTTCTSIVALIINYKWKISLHMIGIGACVALLLMLKILFYAEIYNFLLISIFAAGLIGTSRLMLNEHSGAQIYVGFIIGFVITGGFYFFI